jgi:hypothetical protein
MYNMAMYVCIGMYDMCNMYGYGYQPMAYVWLMAKNNGVMAMYVMYGMASCMYVMVSMNNRHVYV